jgi:hypothetical protein
VTPGGLQAGVVFDEFVEDDRETIEGALIVKANLEEAGVAGLISWRFALPELARSAGGTVAISSMGLPGEVCVAATAGTYVVGSEVVTLLLFTH